MRDRFYVMTDMKTGRTWAADSAEEAAAGVSESTSRVVAVAVLRKPMDEGVLSDAARKVARASKDIYDYIRRSSRKPPGTGGVRVTTGEDIVNAIRNRLLDLNDLRKLAGAIPALGSILTDAARQAGYNARSAADAVTALGQDVVNRILQAGLRSVPAVENLDAAVDTLLNEND